MIITIAVCATAEVARLLRFLNLAFGLWLIAAPWLLAGATTRACLNDIVAGLIVIGLDLPRGHRSEEHYGPWGRYVV
jgi:SPW repeat-containing protein